MGIRFYCPNGHRLNVKSFLAGKRGVCPHCNVSVEIPLESQLPSRKQRREARAQGASAGGGGTAPAAVAPPLAPTSPTGPATPTGPLTPAGPLSPAVRVAAGPAIAAGESLGSDFSPWSGAVPMGTAVSTRSVLEPASPLPTSPMPTSPVPTFTAPASAALAATDPISQAPEAVWYVRPPSGGQYGPARGDVMRRWIDEGRVTADSLLWRDGWVDWQEAGQVFPGLSGVADLPGAGNGLPATTFPLPERPTTPSAARAGRTRRKKSPYVGVAIVAVLVLVSLGLLVTLVWVLSNR